jgi:hypothetical protein
MLEAVSIHRPDGQDTSKPQLKVDHQSISIMMTNQPPKVCECTLTRIHMMASLIQGPGWQLMGGYR